MATPVAESSTATPARPRSRVPLPPKLKRAGWYRAALFDVLGLGFAVGITALLRWANHQHPVIDAHAITIVALFSVPIFFLVGLGACDYWLYWASGPPTRPED